MQQIYRFYGWSSSLFILIVLMASCSGSKPERIQFQIYKDDRLIFSAFHRANINQPQAELWNELHKKIQFTAIDGNPSVPVSNNLFNRKPYIKPYGSITILILQKDQVLAQKTLDTIKFKPHIDQKTWILDFGEAERIIQHAHQTGEMDGVLPEDKIHVPDELSEPEPTKKNRGNMKNSVNTSSGITVE